MKQYDIGIDLGTTSIIIATEEQGVVFRQPTIGAVDTRTNSIELTFRGVMNTRSNFLRLHFLGDNILYSGSENGTV